MTLLHSEYPSKHKTHSRALKRTNLLDPYRDVLQAAREKRFREWEPKIRYLAKQINSGAISLPPDRVLLDSLMVMKERNGVIDMATVDSNCRMLAQAVWDAKFV